jgi:hypothetical protein
MATSRSPELQHTESSLLCMVPSIQREWEEETRRTDGGEGTMEEALVFGVSLFISLLIDEQRRSLLGGHRASTTL